MEAIPGLKFSSVERHTLPALCNGFSREYKKEWMESFKNHLQQYDASKLEVAMRALMKQLAATLSRQREIQHEFEPKFQEYSEKKAAGTLGESHLKPLFEIFTEEQLRSIPVDDKAG